MIMKDKGTGYRFFNGRRRGNVLQPQRVSLASGLRRNSIHASACAAALTTVRLMRTQWLVPAPQSCDSEQMSQFGSCTLSTTAVLRALQRFGACHAVEAIFSSIQGLIGDDLEPVT